MVNYFRYNFFLLLFSNFVISNIMHHCPCLLEMDPYEGEKPKNNKHKEMTKKTMIIKK